HRIFQLALILELHGEPVAREWIARGLRDERPECGDAVHGLSQARGVSQRRAVDLLTGPAPYARSSPAPSPWGVVQEENTLQRPFTTFVGIDLGGARGKTTAVAILTRRDDMVAVDEVATRRVGEPWHDESLWEYLSVLGPNAAIAINAPLTAPACVRC